MPVPVPDPSLTDGTITLRPFTLADVDDVTIACQDPEISRWTSLPSPYTTDHARLWILSHEHSWSSGERAPFAITATSDGAFLGSVSFSSFSWPTHTAEMGYWIARGARRQRVATRAVGLLCQWGFQSLNVTSIYLRTMIGNIGSEGVAKRAGFTKVGQIDNWEHPRTPGHLRDITLWERTIPT